MPVAVADADYGHYRTRSGTVPSVVITSLRVSSTLTSEPSSIVRISACYSTVCVIMIGARAENSAQEIPNTDINICFNTTFVGK